MEHQLLGMFGTWSVQGAMPPGEGFPLLCVGGVAVTDAEKAPPPVEEEKEKEPILLGFSVQEVD